MKFFRLFFLVILCSSLSRSALGQAAELNIHSGHSAWIKDFCISPNEKYLATASYDYTVKLWDFRAGKELRTLRGHKDYVTSVKFSADGSLLVSGDMAGQIIIWDVITGQLLKTLTPRHYAEVTSVEFSADNKRILSCSRDHKLMVADIDTDRELSAFNLETAGLKARFMPDNNFIASLDDKGELFIWDIRGDSSYKGVYYYQGRITDFAISRDGSAFFTTVESDTSNIRMLDIESWTTRGWLKGHPVYPASVATTDDDQVIYTASFRMEPGKPVTYSTEIRKWNVASRECLDSFVISREGVHDYSLEYLPGSRQLVSMMSTTRLGVLNAVPVSFARAIRGGGTLINAVYETSPGNFLLIGDDGPIKSLNLEKNEYRISGPGLPTAAIRQASLSNDKKHLFALAYADSSIYKIDLANNEKTAVVKGPLHIREYFLNREQDHILYRGVMIDSLERLTNHSTFVIQQLDPDSVIARLDIPSFMIIPYALLQDNRSVIFQRLADTLTIWDSRTNRMRYLADSAFNGSPVTRFVPVGEEQFLVITQTGKLQCWNWKTGKLLRSVEAHDSSWIFNAILSPTEEFLLTCSDDKTVKLWRTADLALLKTFRGHESWISQAGFMSDQKRIFSSGADYTLRIWDLDMEKEIASLILVDTADLVTRLPNNFYSATRQATRFLSYRIGNELFPFEQFDLRYNRPHEVLRGLGTKDTALVRAFEMAYDKRLRRSGFSESDFNEDLHLPETVVPGAEKIPQVTTGSLLPIKIRATDNKYLLDRYYISVNNVPVNGNNGKSLVNLKTHSFETTEKIVLSEGLNRIVVSCMNEKGVESLRKEIYTRYQPSQPARKKVYFIGIGASHFADGRMNLQYADKDIRDLVNVFRSRYPDLEVDTFLNRELTRERVLGIREKLRHTGVDDIVIVSVSSHGLLDEKLDYYIATHNMNFQDPASRGLKYEELEGLLSDIPARRKLLMIDACHSGEVDKDELPGPGPVDDSITLRENENAKGIKPKPRIGQQNSFELMKELFTDISRGNGAIVISAAAGKEFALENSTWNNGVFTFSLKKALIENLADLNGDGITVNELKNFVSDQVERYTNGRQRPTTRKENLEFDWKIW